MEATNYNSPVTPLVQAVIEPNQNANGAIENIYVVKEAAMSAGNKDQVFSLILYRIVQHFDELTGNGNDGNSSVMPDELREAIVILCTSKKESNEGLITITVNDFIDALDALKYHPVVSSGMAQKINAYSVDENVVNNGIELHNSRANFLSLPRVELKKNFIDNACRSISSWFKPTNSPITDVDWCKQLPQEVLSHVYCILSTQDGSRLAQTCRDMHLTYGREVIPNLMNEEGRKVFYSAKNLYSAKDLFRDHTEYRLPPFQASGDNGIEHLKKLGYNFGPNIIKKIRNRELTAEEGEAKLQEYTEHNLYGESLFKYVSDGSFTPEMFKQFFSWYGKLNEETFSNFLFVLNFKPIQKYLDNGKLKMKHLVEVYADPEKYMGRIFIQNICNSQELLDSGVVTTEDVLEVSLMPSRQSLFANLAIKYKIYQSS